MDSSKAHCAADTPLPAPWPEGVIPYDVSRLPTEHQLKVLQAMQRWTDTGASLRFIPRTDEKAFVLFTGRTDAGNNTSHTGYLPGTVSRINISAFWWRGSEWMIVHELGHVLGFHHEHQRWDRNAHLTVRYEHIKAGRAHDYDWIPRDRWLVRDTGYDPRSIMHYRVCWASACEDQCRDADGASPCAVLNPHGTEFDSVIGQWDQNGVSALDAEEARRAYPPKETTTAP